MTSLTSTMSMKTAEFKGLLGRLTYLPFSKFGTRSWEKLDLYLII